MKASDDNLMNSSLRSVGRCELPLLQTAFHKQVVSLIAAEGGIRQSVVERQAVPICVVQLLPSFPVYRYVSPIRALATFIPEGKKRSSGRKRYIRLARFGSSAWRDFHSGIRSEL